MTPVATAPTTPQVPQPYPLSREAYHLLGETGYLPQRTELLYGRVFEKMPESPLDRLLFMRLLNLLQRAVPPGMHVQPEKPLTCTHSEPVPDLSVVRGSIEDYASEHPATAELILEVCVSSPDYDRSKLAAYAAAQVKEVWLVLAPERQIEVHRQPLGEQFRERVVHGPGGTLTSPTLPQFVVELDRLFAEVQHDNQQ